jgi:hypothetical protein
VQKVDRVLFEISALVIVLDDHSDVFVSGHALHLAVGDALAIDIIGTYGGSAVEPVSET